MYSFSNFLLWFILLIDRIQRRPPRSARPQTPRPHLAHLRFRRIERRRFHRRCGVRRRQRCHVSRRHDRVRPPHGEHDVDLAGLQVLICRQGHEAPADAEGARADEKVAGRVEHELGRGGRPVEVAGFGVAGKDDLNGARAGADGAGREGAGAGDAVAHGNGNGIGIGIGDRSDDDGFGISRLAVAVLIQGGAQEGIKRQY